MSNGAILRCMSRLQRLVEEYKRNLKHFGAISKRKGGPNNNFWVFTPKDVWEKQTNGIKKQFCK